MLQERLPAALKSHAPPHWLEEAQILSNFRLLTLDPPSIESSLVDQTQSFVLIETVWRPRMEARVRVKRVEGQGSFDVTIVSMELRATVKTSLGSKMTSSGLSLAQPMGLDFFLTAHCSPGKRIFYLTLRYKVVNYPYDNMTI